MDQASTGVPRWTPDFKLGSLYRLACHGFGHFACWSNLTKGEWLDGLESTKLLEYYPVGAWGWWNGNVAIEKERSVMISGVRALYLWTIAKIQCCEVKSRRFESLPPHLATKPKRHQ